MFDNAENPDDIHEYIPAAGNGYSLITSRNPGIQHELAIEGRKISSFDHADGREFLLGLLPGANKNDISTQKAAGTISQYLGGLALGLKQIGGFMRETGCNFDDLLASLRDKEQEKQIFGDTVGLASLGYSHNLANVWRVSLSALDVTTTNILLFYSFLDPDQVPGHITKALRDSCCRHPNLFPEATSNVK